MMLYNYLETKLMNINEVHDKIRKRVILLFWFKNYHPICFSKIQNIKLYKTVFSVSCVHDASYHEGTQTTVLKRIFGL